jgi:hypothetical protein
LEFLTKKAQGSGAPLSEFVPQLRAKLKEHPGCQDVAAEISEEAIEAIAIAARTPQTPVEAAKKNKAVLPKPLPLDATVIPSTDFIRDYVAYADRFEIPPRLHEIVAMAGIAAAVNGRVTINTGDTIIPFDFWASVLTRSGGVKNTLLRAFQNLMKAAGLEQMIHKESFGSAAQIQEYFSKNPVGFFIWPEMGGTLAQLKQKQFVGGLEWLTNCYDETERPDDKHYRETADPDDQTPSIEYEEAPRISIVALTAESAFYRNADGEQVTGGFLARWMPVIISDLSREVSRPVAANPLLIPPLVEKLKQIASLRGEMDISQVAEMYDNWYRETKRRFEQHSNQEFVDPFWRRHRNHLWKLAGVYELATSGELIIRPESMQRAIAMCRELEKNIFRLVQTNFSPEGVKAQNLEKFVRDAGPSGRKQYEVFEYLTDIPRLQAEDRIRMLMLRERVFWFKRKNPNGRAGRQPLVMVHADHLDEHTRLHAATDEAIAMTFKGSR